MKVKDAHKYIVQVCGARYCLEKYAPFQNFYLRVMADFDAGYAASKGHCFFNLAIAKYTINPVPKTSRKERMMVRPVA